MEKPRIDTMVLSVGCSAPIALTGREAHIAYSWPRSVFWACCLALCLGLLAPFVVLDKSATAKTVEQHGLPDFVNGLPTAADGANGNPPANGTDGLAGGDATADATSADPSNTAGAGGGHGQSGGKGGSGTATAATGGIGGNGGNGGNANPANADSSAGGAPAKATAIGGDAGDGATGGTGGFFGVGTGNGGFGGSGGKGGDATATATATTGDPTAMAFSGKGGNAGNGGAGGNMNGEGGNGGAGGSAGRAGALAMGVANGTATAQAFGRGGGNGGQGGPAGGFFGGGDGGAGGKGGDAVATATFTMTGSAANASATAGAGGNGGAGGLGAGPGGDGGAGGDAEARASNTPTANAFATGGDGGGGGAGGGGAASGGSADANALASGNAGIATNAIATATGGNVSSTGNTGATRPSTGNATAGASAFSNGAAANATATAVVPISANPGLVRDGAAMASSSANGVGGNAKTLSQVGGNQIIRQSTANDAAPVPVAGGAAANSVAEIGLAAPDPSSLALSQAASIAVGQPIASDISTFTTGKPTVQDRLELSNSLGLGWLSGGYSPTSLSSLDYTSSVDFQIDPSLLGPNDGLGLGLLGSSFASTGFDSLTFDVRKNGLPFLSVSFDERTDPSALASAQSFFDDNVVSLGAADIGSSGVLDLQFDLDISESIPGPGYTVNFLVAPIDEPSALSLLSFGAVGLWFACRRSSLRIRMH
jgi:hypothetical protein